MFVNEQTAGRSATTLLPAWVWPVPGALRSHTLISLARLADLSYRPVLQPLSPELALHLNATRVLIVDDNAMFIEMASVVLFAAGYDTVGAPDADGALLQIPVFLPDLILMDLQMPVIGGLELTRLLKADPATQHIVIVAFTAYALRGDALTLKAAGFDGYIAKPIEVTTLAAEVRFWLEGPQSARASHFVWP